MPASSSSTITTTSAGTRSATSSRPAGRLLIGYGGTQAIEQRRAWSPVARGLRDELGIDTDEFFTAVDQTLYTKHGMGQGVFFDRETWGVDRLVSGGRGNPAEGPVPPDGWWREFARQAPFSDARAARLRPAARGAGGLSAGLSVEEKRAQAAVDQLQGLPAATTRRWIRRSPAISSSGTHSGLGHRHRRGAGGVGRRAPGRACRVSGCRAPAATAPNDPYIFHFPDGNASIARLLVRALIPAVSATGTTMEDIVTARFDYRRLDEAPVTGPHAAEQHGRAGAARRRPGGTRDVVVTYVTAARRSA